MNTWRIEALVPNRSGDGGRHWTEIDSDAIKSQADEMARKYRATGLYLKVRVVNGHRTGASR